MEKTTKYLLLVGSVFVYTIARGKITTDYDVMIKRISDQHGNNPNLVKAFIKIESNFNPNAHRVTKKENSRGLGQINQNTAIALGISDFNTLFDPEINVDTINKLITDLKTRYENTCDLIASYNAGRVILNKYGFYVNSGYVLNVYSRYVAYSLLNI